MFLESLLIERKKIVPNFFSDSSTFYILPEKNAQNS